MRCGLLIVLLASSASLQEPAGPRTADVVRLREMLYNRQQPRLQSQAALLLLQDPSADAEEIVRRGLKQTDSAEVFAALAGAVRLSRDVRFRDELFAALVGGHPTFRQAAAEALVELMDGHVLQRLEAVLADAKADLAVRQAAIWTLGRSGRKQAAGILIDLLPHEHPGIRRAAAEALQELTGREYGNDVFRWREWWDLHKDVAVERWLQDRLDYQASRVRRLESDLERMRQQVVRLQEQLYARLPLADRLGHVLGLVEHDDPAVRALAVKWSSELLPVTDAVGQAALTDLLLRFTHDGTPEVQRQAVLVLGKVTESRALDRLLRLLQSGPPPVRAAAARSLAQQARGQSEAAKARQRVIVPALRNALKDTAVEVVVEAAEDLGSLGVPEAGPVLTDLLRHPSASVRQAASQALERMADVSLLDGLLQALDDPVAAVRFRLVGALGHAVGDGTSLSESPRAQLLERLVRVLGQDADPGVRSRAATVLGSMGPPSLLPVLWRRVVPTEDSRVRDKAWAAFVDILVRAGNADSVLAWEQKMLGEKQAERRLLMLTEICRRWHERDDLQEPLTRVQQVLVPALLEQGKWSAALAHVRDLLKRSAPSPEMERRLRWLLQCGQLALDDGNRLEALRVVQLSQAYRDRLGSLGPEFDRLEKACRQP